MHRDFTIISIALLLCLVRVAHCVGESWDGHTVLTSAESIAALNTIANNLGNHRAERARAVFKLFANYIKPGQTAAEVHKVLTDTAWLQDTNLHGVYDIAGWVPVELTTEDTVFGLKLFSEATDSNLGPWMIWFRLTGHDRTEKEACAFLRGDMTLVGKPQIVEFALCFPSERPLHSGRTERFGRRGIHVYESP
jgi:hypothetical protein